MKGFLRLLVISILLVVALFSMFYGEKSKLVEQLEITEGYVLSKHPDYKTDDRDYTRSDMLYVWAWSSKINPNNVKEHYCQLILNGNVQFFYLNYNPNMAWQYSYTGSFNLSRLEKTGNWTVKIFLRTNPPKPITFNATDVIHVLPTHALRVYSQPISGVSFTINEINRTTPFVGIFVEGTYTVCVPLRVHVNGKVYTFAGWDDETTELIRRISLTKDTSITAYYNPPREASTIKGKVYDYLGNPLVGAIVTILETKQSMNTSTEPVGYYEFNELPPSTYTLRVEIAGYNSSLAFVVADPAGTYTRDFYLKPLSNAKPIFHFELWQGAAGSLALFGATTYLVLRRRRIGKKIEENKYRTILEGVKLEAMLQELKNLSEKRLINSENYETMQRELNEELTKIRGEKN